MAFKLQNFQSDYSNVKNILGGICYYRYWNEDGDTVTTKGFLPKTLGLKQYDRVTVIAKTPTTADTTYYCAVDATTGDITLTALS